MKEILKVSSSPHIKHPETTRGIMADVIIALLPAAIFGCILFGLRALLVLLVCVAAAVASEFLWNLILKKPNTIGDLSAVLTGLLLGMNLSPKIPLYMAAIGSVAAIIVVKQMFGGLGHNFVNPAIAARIILMVSFPSAMNRFSDPVFSVGEAAKIVTSATPLSDSSAAVSLKYAFFGFYRGCIGETCTFLLIIGGIYLIVRKIISPAIPLSFLATVAVLSLISHQNVAMQLCTGGLMLGAIFMATDYTTSPKSPIGKIIYGIGCGAITFIIRKFGSLPEGVSYSIILMNIITPLIDRFTLRKPFGFKKAVKADE